MNARRSPKEIFMSKPSIRALSLEEQEKRWSQHQASKKGASGRKTTKNPTSGRSTRPAGSRRQANLSKNPRTLSNCSINYALALSDPWDVPAPPCVPDNVTIESWKFSVRARGTGVVGSAGVGFIAFNPFNPYAFSSGNVISGIVTDSTPFAGANYATSGAGVVSVSTDATQPYTNADNLDQAYRVVGSGLKVCYVGNEMNRQGLWTLYRDPSNSPIVSGTSNQTLLNFRETVQVPVDKNWHCVLYKPSTASDVMYAPRGNDLDGTALATKLYNTNPSLLAILTGGTPGASFQYDFITWFEMTGRGLPALTTSEADPLGLSSVSAAVSSHQPESTPQQNAIAFAKSIDSHVQNFSLVDNIASVAKAIIPIVEQAAPVIMSLL